MRQILEGAPVRAEWYIRMPEIYFPGFSLSFDFFAGQRHVRGARRVGFAGEKVAGRGSFAASFGPAGPGVGKFRDTGGVFPGLGGCCEIRGGPGQASAAAMGRGVSPRGGGGRRPGDGRAGIGRARP